MSRFLVFALLAAFLAAFVSAIPSGNDQTPLVPSKPHTTASWQLDNCGACAVAQLAGFTGIELRIFNRQRD